jgi:hypothetical protein
MPRVLMMCAADGLLALQSTDCNDQIPARAYKYIRASKPVLGLCGAGSDTEGVLQRAGMLHLAPLESTELVVLALRNFVTTLQSVTSATRNTKFVESFSRFSKARELAQLLDEVRLEHLAQHPAIP